MIVLSDISSQIVTLEKITHNFYLRFKHTVKETAGENKQHHQLSDIVLMYVVPNSQN